MEWEKLTDDNLPEPGTWVLITDGTDWLKVFVTNQFEFVEHPDDKMCYQKGITHFCRVVLPGALPNISCRFCQNLQMALPGDSNTEDFEQKLFDLSRPHVELFCANPSGPEIFWNERSGNDPEMMLDQFRCNHFISNGG